MMEALYVKAVSAASGTASDDCVERCLIYEYHSRIALDMSES